MLFSNVNYKLFINFVYQNQNQKSCQNNYSN